jgi:hypothetical protein
MNTHAPIELSLEHAVAERALRRAERIEMLAVMGMRMAQALEARVFDTPEPMADPSIATELFARISRTMRLTEALGARLDRDLLKVEAQASAPVAASPKTPEEYQRHHDKMDALSWQLTLRARGGVRRDAVREMVEQAIECDARRTGREEDIERLAFDLDDRLKGIDSDADWLNQPLGMAAKWLCGQMGVPSIPPSGRKAVPMAPPTSGRWAAPNSPAAGSGQDPSPPRPKTAR